MRKVILIILNPGERKYIGELLSIAGVQIIGDKGTMTEVRDHLWNRVSNEADHILIDGTDTLSPLWGFEAEPKPVIAGQYGPIRVFKRKQAGADRPASPLLIG